MATAFVFPGQGSQTVDMRERVAEWRPELLDIVESRVGCDPFPRVGESTRFAQPAIYCASMAGLARLSSTGEAPEALAGHSLGEIAALVAGGALDAEEGLRLVVSRGEAMAAAGERRGRAGSMLVVLGGDLAEIEREAVGCLVSVANDNAPGQVVLSGSRGGLVMVSDRLRAAGARTMMLDVAGAFHSPFMADAVGPFSEVLAGIDFERPDVPVWSCSTVRQFGDAADIRAQLAAALVRPVRWRQTVEAMHGAGIDRYLEPGPGQVLTRLVRRTLRDVEVAAYA
jgi:malonyl CoA-acyl carrier protein transacylase